MREKIILILKNLDAQRHESRFLEAPLVRQEAETDGELKKYNSRSGPSWPTV
jgi:hypothetical protein